MKSPLLRLPGTISNCRFLLSDRRASLEKPVSDKCDTDRRLPLGHPWAAVDVIRRPAFVPMEPEAARDPGCFVEILLPGLEVLSVKRAKPPTPTPKRPPRGSPRSGWARGFPDRHQSAPTADIPPYFQGLTSCQVGPSDRGLVSPLRIAFSEGAITSFLAPRAAASILVSSTRPFPSDRIIPFIPSGFSGSKSPI